MKIYPVFFLYFLQIRYIFSSPYCQDFQNLCNHCNKITNLCSICTIPDILVPDENGGCIGAKKCFSGQNYCTECEENGNLCKKCETNYYKDENGGCTYSEGCEISYNGDCVRCKDNFILIGKENDLKICKSIFIENYKNCKEINYETGFCKTCEENYYLTSGDHRCIKTENCKESIFGNCKLCDQGYYFNKKEDKCVSKTANLFYCKQSLDGNNCEICDDDYYLDENGICVDSDFCSESEYLKCKKCKSGYFLSNNNVCVSTDNCYNGDRFIFICNSCQRGFYLDTKDYKCKSNLEDGPFKYCEKYGNNRCYQCEIGYYLGEDLKCTKSQYCEESENGICKSCINDYYLSLDNICTTVKGCIKTNYEGSCIECEDGFYYDRKNMTCLEMKDQYLNCKYSCGLIDQCCECKDNFYLNNNDSLCYDNTKEDKYIKCSSFDSKKDECTKCQEGYYLGESDNRCSKVDNCNIVENEDKCLECITYYCLDVKNQRCIDNDYLNDMNDKMFISCKRTNKEGTSCEECIEGYKIGENGYCVDIDYCEVKNDNGKCDKCKDIKTVNDLYFCANELFGCLETDKENCLRCDNMENLYQCTQCKEGYSKTTNGFCMKNE